MSKFSISLLKNNSNFLFSDFLSNFLSKSSRVSASLLTGKDKREAFFLLHFTLVRFTFGTEVVACNHFVLG